MLCKFHHRPDLVGQSQVSFPVAGKVVVTQRNTFFFPVHEILSLYSVHLGMAVGGAQFWLVCVSRAMFRSASSCLSPFKGVKVQ